MLLSNFSKHFLWETHFVPILRGLAVDRTV